MSTEIRVPSAGQMHDLGRRLAGLVRPGDLLVLSGDLGAGKTTLVQGIGEGLKVRGPVTSPTFVIARVHPSLAGGPPLVHVDAYRLGGIVEVDDLDLDAELDSAVTVVEWGEGLVDGLAADRLQIVIYRGEGEERTVRLTGMGPRWSTVSNADLGLCREGLAPAGSHGALPCRGSDRPCGAVGPAVADRFCITLTDCIGL